MSRRGRRGRRDWSSASADIGYGIVKHERHVRVICAGRPGAAEPHKPTLCGRITVHRLEARDSGELQGMNLYLHGFKTRDVAGYDDGEQTPITDDNLDEAHHTRRWFREAGLGRYTPEHRTMILACLRCDPPLARDIREEKLRERLLEPDNLLKLVSAPELPLWELIAMVSDQ